MLTMNMEEQIRRVREETSEKQIKVLKSLTVSELFICQDQSRRHFVENFHFIWCYLTQILQHAASAVPGSQRRQTILWSATLPHHLERIVRSAVLDPVHLTVGDVRRGAAVRRIVQQVVYCKTFEKKVRKKKHSRVNDLRRVSKGPDFKLRSLPNNQRILLERIRTTPYPPVLIFCNSISNIDMVGTVLGDIQYISLGTTFFHWLFSGDYSRQENPC